MKGKNPETGSEETKERTLAKPPTYIFQNTYLFSEYFQCCHSVKR